MDIDNEENTLPEPTVADLKEQIEEMTARRDEYLAGWQRAKADLINYKKDEANRAIEVARYGSADMIKDLISVMDNFDLALRTLEKSGPVEKGIYLIRTQIDDILKKRGLEKIAIKEGDEFDPATAEALAEVVSEKPAGSVVEVIEQGYRLYEKVLRPARVIVSKGT